MSARVRSVGNKPPKPLNHLSALGMSAVQRPMAGSCQAIFRAAMQERMAKHPFDRVSAYKVGESCDTMRHNLDTVRSVADYQRTRRCDRHFGMLVGCTPDDAAQRMKDVPKIIARELGYNLIPAAAGLTLEGVPVNAIDHFIHSIKPQVDRLLVDCDAVQTATTRSIEQEYAAMKMGNSSLARISADALRIAEQAKAFCATYRVL
jgi:hypothetical protein